MQESDPELQRCVVAATVSGACYMALAFVTWCTFSYLRFSFNIRSTQHTQVPALDLPYHAKVELDIVLNMNDENPASISAMVSEIRRCPNVANKTTRVMIYYKGKRGSAHLKTLNHKTSTTEVPQATKC